MSIKSSLEQFYANPKVVDEFIKIISDQGLITNKTIFIEPSVGDGKFLDGIDKLKTNHQVLAFDIEKIIQK